MQYNKSFGEIMGYNKKVGLFGLINLNDNWFHHFLGCHHSLKGIKINCCFNYMFRLFYNIFYLFLVKLRIVSRSDIFFDSNIYVEER